MDIEKTEHEDLEERFQISAKISFETSMNRFEGLGDIQFEIKKKKVEQPKIENIELRKSKSKRNGLF
jgi:hypothetical protein